MAASKARKVQVTLPDGTVMTRNSLTHVYTHAATVFDKGYDGKERGWFLVGFASSQVLAQKAASTFKPGKRWGETRIIPVEVLSEGSGQAAKVATVKTVRAIATTAKGYEKVIGEYTTQGRAYQAARKWNYPGYTVRYEQIA